MKAKKYFERLGYNQEERPDTNEILYRNKDEDYIIFFKDYKFFIKDNEENNTGIEMDMNELKATIKQCKELGWLDE